MSLIVYYPLTRELYSLLIAAGKRMGATAFKVRGAIKTKKGLMDELEGLDANELLLISYGSYPVIEDLPGYYVDWAPNGSKSTQQHTLGTKPKLEVKQVQAKSPMRSIVDVLGLFRYKKLRFESLDDQAEMILSLLAKNKKVLILGPSFVLRHDKRIGFEWYDGKPTKQGVLYAASWLRDHEMDTLDTSEDGWTVFARDVSTSRDNSKEAIRVRPAYISFVDRWILKGKIRARVSLPNERLRRGLRALMGGQSLHLTGGVALLPGKSIVAVGSSGSGKSAIKRALAQKGIVALETDDWVDKNPFVEQFRTDADTLKGKLPQSWEKVQTAYTKWLADSKEKFEKAPKADVYLVHTMSEAKMLPVGNKQMVFLRVDEEGQVANIRHRLANNDWVHVFIAQFFNEENATDIQEAGSTGWTGFTDMFTKHFLSEKQQEDDTSESQK